MANSPRLPKAVLNLAKNNTGNSIPCKVINCSLYSIRVSHFKKWFNFLEESVLGVA